MVPKEPSVFSETKQKKYDIKLTKLKLEMMKLKYNVKNKNIIILDSDESNNEMDDTSDDDSDAKSNDENQNNDLYEERDRMGYFLKEFYVITNDDDDKIHGDEFVDEYNDFYNTKLKKAFILNEIKKHNIEYNKNRSVNKKRGVLMGLTKKEIEIEIEQ